MAKYAFVVGISTYANPGNDRPGPERDAQSLYAVLHGSGYAVAPPLLNADANYEAICRGLTALLEQAQPGDETFFFFSGHGCRFRDQGNVVHDALAAWDANWATGSCTISDALILQFLHSHLKQGVRMTWLCDACYSGGDISPIAMLLAQVRLTSLPKTFRVPKTHVAQLQSVVTALPNEVHTMDSALIGVPGVVLLASSAPDQPSTDWPSFPDGAHGVMTEFILRQLRADTTWFNATCLQWRNYLNAATAPAPGTWQLQTACVCGDPNLYNAPLFM